MLCDQFAEYIKDPSFNLRLKVEKHAVMELSKKIKTCPRFILERDAVRTIQNITITQPSRLLSAMSMCRLPFPKLWVEFVFKDRSDWLEEMSNQGIVALYRPDASAPTRLGFYIEQLDKEGFVMMVHPVWSHHYPVISVANKAIIMDASPDFKMDMNKFIKMDQKIRQDYSIEKQKWDNRWVMNETEIASLIELAGRIDHIIPDYMEQLWDYINLDPMLAEYMEGCTRYDLAAEWRFATALLTLLNSKNCVEYSKVKEFSKLNKIRTKRKQPQLLSHQVITLSLSKVQKNRMKLMGIHSKEDMNAHLVRGHFKLRKSGLYWWAGHIRGFVGNFNIRKYKVKN